MFEPLHSHLAYVCLLVGIVFTIGCRSRGDYEVAKFDLGKERVVRIYSTDDWEMSQPYLYEVTVNGKTVVGLTQEPS